MAIFKPIDKRERYQIAQRTLKRVKMVCPRFSYPADEQDLEDLVELWASALFLKNVYPRSVYKDALELYAAESSSQDDPPMPGDILRYCDRAVERMESDPELREKLYAWRKERRLARIEQMTGESQGLN